VPAGGKERHTGLAGDRAGQQRLSGPRRADQQVALGEPGTHGDEALRLAQEVDQLAQLGHGSSAPATSANRVEGGVASSAARDRFPTASDRCPAAGDRSGPARMGPAAEGSPPRCRRTRSTSTTTSTSTITSGTASRPAGDAVPPVGALPMETSTPAARSWLVSSSAKSTGYSVR
jgi:hypothetical protein